MWGIVSTGNFFGRYSKLSKCRQQNHILFAGKRHSNLTKGLLTYYPSQKYMQIVINWVIGNNYLALAILDCVDSNDATLNQKAFSITNTQNDHHSISG